MLFLALPSAAQAGFSSQPMPASVHRSTGPSPIVRQPAPDRRDRAGPRDTSELTRDAAYISRELDRARDDIKRHRDSGELTRSEAKELRREAHRIEEMSSRYHRDGLTEFERRELETRTSEFRNRTATGRTS
jgi:hypothetical protein